VIHDVIYQANFGLIIQSGFLSCLMLPEYFSEHVLEIDVSRYAFINILEIDWLIWVAFATLPPLNVVD